MSEYQNKVHQRLADMLFEAECSFVDTEACKYLNKQAYIADYLLANGVEVPVKNPKIVWTGLSERQREVIKAFADCNMNASVTAKRTFTDRNNIYYHIREIRRKTGLNPRCFKDLNKLLSILEKGIDGDME